MEDLIEPIRTALCDDADSAARHAGLVACRKILVLLEATMGSQPASAIPTNAAPGEPNAPGATPNVTTEAPSAPATAGPTAQAAPRPRIDPAMVATVVASLGKLPPEQLLDLAIARLRAALPPGTTVPAPSPLRFQIIPLHHLQRSK
jgi:hypothetical protein